MVCPECKGQGGVHLVPRKVFRGGHQDWVFEDQQCPKCKGKGYLTPEEQGLEKF